MPSIKPRIQVLPRDAKRFEALRALYVGLNVSTLYGVLMSLGIDTLESDPTRLVAALAARTPDEMAVEHG